MSDPKSDRKSAGNEGGESEDPVFIKKLKTEITAGGNKTGLNPLKQAKFKKAMVYTDIRLDFVLFLRDHLRSRNLQGKGSAATTPISSTKLEEGEMRDILTLVGGIASKGNFGSDKFYKKGISTTSTSKKQPKAGDGVGEDDGVDEEEVEKNYVEFKKRFSELWGEVMKWKMTPSIHRQVVILLPEKVMSHLCKPLHMSDFLLESFKIGGPLGVVSLHGIFLLMQNFNFEVPDFYIRLYSMFTPETLSSKYRARFFAYSREFLQSTHLPESLVASFIKRLSRLSLFAPAPALPMIFDFIINLIIEHPGLKMLLNPLNQAGEPKIRDLSIPDEWDSDFETFMNSGNGATEIKAESPDPFDENEMDPMKTKAIESWLCEIKALQNHTVSSIALKAKFINKSIPKVEQDLDETLSLNYKDIQDQEREMSDKLEPTPSHVKPVVEMPEEDAPSVKRLKTVQS